MDLVRQRRLLEDPLVRHPCRGRRHGDAREEQNSAHDNLNCSHRSENGLRIFELKCMYDLIISIPQSTLSQELWLAAGAVACASSACCSTLII